MMVLPGSSDMTLLPTRNWDMQISSTIFILRSYLSASTLSISSCVLLFDIRICYAFPLRFRKRT